MKKRVYIAYTGGTIGMMQTPAGYKPIEGYLAKRMAAMPELQHTSMPSYTLHEYSPLLDSANMHPRNWQAIATDISRHYEDYDGFVVIHGTDTMAYTASALSFMLGSLAKPVILTGSQIPLAEVRSDARENLITSMLLAANSNVPEVCLFVNGNLLRGNRSTKVNSSGFEAFASPNYPPLATVGVDITVNDALIRSVPTTPLEVTDLKRTQIAALRLFPGISAEILENFLLKPIQGLVLETYGAGNAPQDKDLLAVLETACKRGVVIVNCTQCLTGSVDMKDYAAGQELADIGVVSGYDMTAEAALTKLYFLFSLSSETAFVSEKIQENLRGELTVA